MSLSAPINLTNSFEVLFEEPGGGDIEEEAGVSLPVSAGIPVTQEGLDCKKTKNAPKVYVKMPEPGKSSEDQFAAPVTSGIECSNPVSGGLYQVHLDPRVEISRRQDAKLVEDQALVVAASSLEDADVAVIRYYKGDSGELWPDCGSLHAYTP